MNLNIDLSALKDITNEKYYPLYRDKSRYLILYGGAGSGKSHFAAQKILIRILAGMEKGIRHKFLAVRKTQPALRKSVFQLLKDYIEQWGLRPICKINITDMTINFIGGSSIICAGLDDPEKLKSIEGVTSIWGEEANELTLNDSTQLNLRLRGKYKAYKQIIYTFNPISKLTWLYKYFFENERDSCTRLQTTYKDNRFLDDEYKKELEGYKDLDNTIYQIYTLGEWGILENIIYTKYQIINKWTDGFDEEIYGLDFGFNNPNALVHIGLRDKEPYIRELLYEAKMTNADLIRRLETLIPNKDKQIFCDNAEPARIEELNRAGFNAYPADKSVKDGIDHVKQQKLKILKSSSNLIKEIDGYKYKETKDGDVLDEPVKFNDHLMDAKRYALYTYYLQYCYEPGIIILD